MKASEPRSTWRQNLIEAAIGAAVATVVSILVVGLLRSAIKPSDALAFLGAAVGAGLAVLGALWVERWKRQEQDRRQQAVLVDVLFEFRELVCQATNREEPTKEIPADINQRFNLRGRFIEETAAMAETLERQLTTFDPPSGMILRTAVRLRRELQKQEFMRDPEGYRMSHNENRLAFIPTYYGLAKAHGPVILEAIDNLVGALHSYGIGKIDLEAGERKPNPPIEIM